MRGSGNIAASASPAFWTPPSASLQWPAPNHGLPDLPHSPRHACLQLRPVSFVRQAAQLLALGEHEEALAMVAMAPPAAAGERRQLEDTIHLAYGRRLFTWVVVFVVSASKSCGWFARGDEEDQCMPVCQQQAAPSAQGFFCLIHHHQPPDRLVPPCTVRPACCAGKGSLTRPCCILG